MQAPGRPRRSWRAFAAVCARPTRTACRPEAARQGRRPPLSSFAAEQEINRESIAMRSRLAVISALAVALAGPGLANAKEQKIGDPPEAHDMRLVGYSDLQARSAYQ